MSGYRMRFSTFEIDFHVAHELANWPRDARARSRKRFYELLKRYMHIEQSNRTTLIRQTEINKKRKEQGGRKREKKKKTERPFRPFVSSVINCLSLFGYAHVPEKDADSSREKEKARKDRHLLHPVFNPETSERNRDSQL
ncbi:hypothetical protein PUN28_012060 [Cardiocondyla obscurior]|uniref:Uncharacterized protein n=1 Tax=Cardiocondyla obscurior TaxID=286306 RepID=A0AAW2F932_9HYME